VRQLELRRHARRDPQADRLSAQGRAQAEDAGRASGATYAIVFVSPAERAAETAAWFLRGTGQQLPEHAVIPGLAGQDATGGTPESMATGVRALLERVPEGGRGLAISHSPLVEAAALGLTGVEVAPMAVMEGILVSLAEDGTIAIEELRRGGSSA
jgi:phosphohistidine phosphatase SixA